MNSICSFKCKNCGECFQIKFSPITKESDLFCSKQCYDGLYTKQLSGAINTMTKAREFAERKNTGKPQMSYVDMHCLVPAAQVLEFGANKYARNNWKKGMPVTKILDSLMRHIGDLQDGKVLDDDSKLAIIGHIQCNAMFLGNKNNEDDITPDNSLYK